MAADVDGGDEDSTRTAAGGGGGRARAGVSRVAASCFAGAATAMLFASCMALVRALFPGAGDIVAFTAAGALTGGAVQAGREAAGAATAAAAGRRRRAAPPTDGKTPRV
jgi:hypothetical protein